MVGRCPPARAVAAGNRPGPASRARAQGPDRADAPAPSKAAALGRSTASSGGWQGGGRAAARPEQRDRWPSPRGSGLKADTADALSAKFFNQMGHEWEHRVAWGRDLPSALQRQRTVIPHRPVPGKAVALCAPGPRAPGPSVGVAPGPSAMNGLGSALLLRFPPNVWESVISPESSVWAAFSAAERGTEAPWGTHAEGHRSSPASELAGGRWPRAQRVITPNPSRRGGGAALGQNGLLVQKAPGTLRGVLQFTPSDGPVPPIRWQWLKFPLAKHRGRQVPRATADGPTMVLFLTKRRVKRSSRAGEAFPRRPLNESLMPSARTSWTAPGPSGDKTLRVY